MQPKDVGIESLEEIMDYMDEHMLKQAMSKMQSSQPASSEVGKETGDDDFEIAQPVPMAKRDDEEELDEDSMRSLMEQYERELV